MSASAARRQDSGRRRCPIARLERAGGRQGPPREIVVVGSKVKNVVRSPGFRSTVWPIPGIEHEDIGYCDCEPPAAEYVPYLGDVILEIPTEMHGADVEYVPYLGDVILELPAKGGIPRASTGAGELPLRLNDTVATSASSRIVMKGKKILQN